MSNSLGPIQIQLVAKPATITLAANNPMANSSGLPPCGSNMDRNVKASIGWIVSRSNHNSPSQPQTRSTPARCNSALINTPLQRGACGDLNSSNRFNGFPVLHSLRRFNASTLLLLLLCASFICLVCRTSLAHTPDTSYCRVAITPRNVECKFSFDIATLQRITPLDANNDGILSQSELE